MTKTSRGWGNEQQGAGGNALCGLTAYANHARSYKASQVAQSGSRMTGKLYAPVGELVKKSEINCKTTRRLAIAPRCESLHAKTTRFGIADNLHYVRSSTPFCTVVQRVSPSSFCFSTSQIHDSFARQNRL